MKFTGAALATLGAILIGGIATAPPASATMVGGYYLCHNAAYGSGGYYCSGTVYRSEQYDLYIGPAWEKCKADRDAKNNKPLDGGEWYCKSFLV
ncbi:MAG: hypothetical protein ACRCSN_10030 [Dermatophilaceae bacterium]